MNAPQNINSISINRDFSKDYGMSEWERNFYIFLMIFSTIYFNLFNVILILKRKNYIIKHRGLILTIPAAIISYFIIINILVRILNIYIINL